MIFWLLLTGLIAYLCYSVYSIARQLPPGPMPLPLIGNLHQLAFGIFAYKGVISVVRNWQKKYGNVHTFWMGPMPWVFVCDFQTAQEVMVRKGANFADRKRLYFFEIERAGKGIISANGEMWQEQRRFTLQTLRNFGMGKNVMEERVMLELDYRMGLLDKEIEASGGHIALDPYNFIELTVGNVLNRLLFTHRFLEEEEKEFFRLKGILDDMMEQTSIFDLILTEENSEWPIFKGRKERISQPVNEIRKFVRGQIEKRKAAIAAGDHELRENGEDFVDAYLIEMQKRGKDENFDEDALYVTMMDLWGAGQETTTSTLYWAFSYLAQNPHDFKRLQDEIDKITGRNRTIGLADKANTPFLNAVVLEVLRASSIVPLNMIREAKEDIIVGNYVVPKGTAIAAQISLIMSDDKLFKEPQKFNPSRYLEEERIEQYVVPFGMGKRACPGESLARAEMYLIIGNMALNYNLSACLGYPLGMEARSEMGNVRKPKPYKLLISRRT